MRFLILGCAVLALTTLPAQAMENFIPLGQNYAPGENEVPPIGSEQDRINTQVDIYQTENYTRDLREQQFETRLNHYSPNPRSPDPDFLDY